MRFVLGASAWALIAAVPLLALASRHGNATLGWAALGWLLAAVGGVGCGARLVRLHGREGTAFLVTVGACMLGRLAAYTVGAGAAAGRGMEAVWAYLAGLAAGYLPVQVFEMVWFARRTGRS